MTIAPVPVDEAVPGPRPDAVDDDALLALYREMVRVRAFEDEVIDAFAKGLIPGSTHPCIGAEGIKAGALSTLRPDDLVFATYRGHGEVLIKGVDPVAMMAELMGRATGVCKGKGGSMHLSEPSVGLISTNAIVAGPHSDGRRRGAVVPVPEDRAGRALLLRRRRLVRGRVLRGDEHGHALEGAARLHLREQRRSRSRCRPRRARPRPDIADRARGFGMPAAIVDGNDVLAVRDAVAEGVERARAGGGPTFVECKTVRWERHSAFSAGGSDPGEQRRAWQRVDPIPRFRKSLVAWGVATDAELDELDAERPRRRCARCARRPSGRRVPAPESVYEDVFAP